MGRQSIRVARGEMELLSLLWGEGALTLREAHERFGSYGTPVSYPTMQTRLNRLVEKALVARSDDRPARYLAVVTREQVTLGHLRELIDKLTGGDVVPLVARLLSEQPLTPGQIAELQDLIKKAREKSQQPPRSRRTP